MAIELLRLLIRAALAASLAIILIAALRMPLRYFLGARSAYWIWLLLPLSVIAVLLPAPSNPAALPISDLPAVLANATAQAGSVLSANDHAAAWLGLWGAGCALAVVVLTRLQRSFVRALGRLQRDANGDHRSAHAAGPALIGAWRPRLVLPTDFETRYSPEQRTLVLAHERAHLRRGDALVNALAAAGLCLLWFNPLAYWALGRFRFDQELACDAEVLSRSAASRRCYADAMLKTQLAVDAAWRLPVGCHWQACHPLKERISMLKRPLPSDSRRFAGTALAIVLSVLASYAAWAASLAEPAAKPRHLTSVLGSETLTPPIYPPQAKANKQEGMVMLEILVAADGSVRDVRVVSAKPAGIFEQASIDAARQWKFQPGRMTGRFRVPVEFALDGPPAEIPQAAK